MTDLGFSVKVIDVADGHHLKLSTEMINQVLSFLPSGPTGTAYIVV
jgi:hypothetical protein